MRIRVGRRVMNKLADLFTTFAKIGLFTFGGGYAMISMIEHECVENKGWIDHDDMLNVTLMAESTPGPIAINCATFVGFRQAGLAGAAIATLGMALPSFIIIFAISMFLDDFLQFEIVAHAFAGIKIAVGILIVDAAVTMIAKMKKAAFPLAVMLCACAVMLVSDAFDLHVSSVTLLLVAAAVGIVAFAVRNAAAHSEGGAR